MDSRKFIVRPPENRHSLLDFLARHLEASKKTAKRLLDSRMVFVNRQRVWMARHELNTGDEVEIHVLPTRPEERPIALLYRDDGYIVANKPPGLLSNGPDSVESRLRAQLNLPRLEAVHRLDRDTSGCLLFAADAARKNRMVPLFEDRRVTKVYHAIVFGQVSDSLREISSPIDALPAMTRVQILTAARRASHVKLLIETGRTHQIRKHMISVRHPVVGDKAYATGDVPSPVLRQIPRQMLHASGLSFTHPETGADIRVKAPLPGDFRACLRLFKLT